MISSNLDARKYATHALADSLEEVYRKEDKGSKSGPIFTSSRFRNAECTQSIPKINNHTPSPFQFGFEVIYIYI